MENDKFQFEKKLKSAREEQEKAIVAYKESVANTMVLLMGENDDLQVRFKDLERSRRYADDRQTLDTEVQKR